MSTMAGSSRARANSRTRGSMSWTHRGLNTLPVSRRSFPCAGGSIARKKLVLVASVPHRSGSREMPLRLENTAGLRSADSTSSYRDNAQKSRSALR